MQMPDVNVLIYAHRSEDPNHAFYRAWMERLVNSPEPFALSALVAVAFVRIVTHPSFRPLPTPLRQALAAIDAFRMMPNCRFLAGGRRHWELMRGLCEKSGATGKRVADAQHAAVAMEHGCTWVTRDADFRDFQSAGLRLEMLEA